MDQQRRKNQQQLRRRRHVRNRIVGTVEKPRLSVHRSSKHIYAQLIDDLNSVTLVSASSCGKKGKDGIGYGGNVKAAATIGKQLAELAKDKGITKVAFDRGHYKYHGRVKALADAARESGLQF